MKKKGKEKGLRKKVYKKEVESEISESKGREGDEYRRRRTA